METSIAAPEIVYTNPFEDITPRKSQAWYNLRKSYLAFKVNLKVSHEQVPLDRIERNFQDGGKWRWDTPLFDSEVDALISSIKFSNTFEAVWLKKQGEQYSVLDGHHRLAAWKKLGYISIPAVVVEVSER